LWAFWPEDTGSDICISRQPINAQFINDPPSPPRMEEYSHVKLYSDGTSSPLRINEWVPCITLLLQ